MKQTSETSAHPTDTYFEFVVCCVILQCLTIGVLAQRTLIPAKLVTNFQQKDRLKMKKVKIFIIIYIIKSCLDF